MLSKVAMRGSLAGGQDSEKTSGHDRNNWQDLWRGAHAFAGGCGVDTVLGMPGKHTQELYRGIETSNPRHILVRHEGRAGFMAGGYAKASVWPGVCTLITGPGVTNAATPLAQAYADSVPVLILSSANRNEGLGKGWGCPHEITDQRAVTAPLTAFSHMVTDPEELPELIAQTFTLFKSR